MLASVKSGTFCQQNCADRNTEKKKQRQWLGDKSKYIFVCGNWQRCAINAKTDKNFEELVKSKGNPIQRKKKLLLSLPDILAKRNSIQLYVIALIFIINQVRTDTNTYNRTTHLTFSERQIQNQPKKRDQCVVAITTATCFVALHTRQTIEYAFAFIHIWRIKNGTNVFYANMEWFYL